MESSIRVDRSRSAHALFSIRFGLAQHPRQHLPRFHVRELTGTVPAGSREGNFTPGWSLMSHYYIVTCEVSVMALQQMYY